eukprot:CAMPEP_0194027100 /NCGR_PEP_ID=MMETSP0009_2-20130614/1328_1 /TAXON_ID=210454 /ORGANISM="Grammatophora oceanica, Strain CCMP 410" /LENGTH=209 /DNA_ID=CAMNT_0038666051 /DNA_START=74 /DNA_END=703 /DNA_ORIENTATION=+
MKVSVLFATVVSVAAAFVPHSKKAQTSKALKAYESEIGAQPPLGFWDPLGLLAEADDVKFNRLRYVEIKHGRISMLAVIGHIVTSAGSRLPGDIDYSGTAFTDIPPGLAALGKIPTAGLAQIIAFVGFLELFVMKDVSGDGEFVGDFRNGALDFGWDNFSPEEQERKRAIEINQGRAAMMGILALMVHEMLPSHDPYMINALIGQPVDF